MKSESKVHKALSRGQIFKLSVALTYIVSGAFLVKDILGNDMRGALIIGVVLVVFTAILLGMIFLKVKYDTQRLVVSSCLIVLLFVISLTTGTYYSEDFCLYLAVIGLTGLYLKPAYSYVQLVLSDIFLIIQYVVHPEKADPLSQFIMCVITFTLAGTLFCQVISRGRSFIERSQMRASEAEELLKSMNNIGQELQDHFNSSSGRTDSLKAANAQMRDSADLLQHSSESISSGSHEVFLSCDQVQVQIHETEENIQKLNSGVHNFEEVLNTNRRNMAEMNSQMNTVRHAMEETTRVFRILDEQMQKISAVTDEINKIASNTGLLAVNASIEAARAGAAGKGFAVVATNVRDLAVSSTQCSNEVADVVLSMKNQIETTSRQMKDSAQAIDLSLSTLSSFQQGFDELTEQFSELYENIEAQNRSIDQVSSIFTGLKDRVSDMSASSDENQTSVQSITETMRIYRDNIAAVIEDNLHIQELSENMLNVALSGMHDEELD
ncbi:MAG: methyl-accepting chemotaxis protein [Oscillospiraceae bacterium]|nr:methyl-accepting chemotaxis protein [Oscillospiraceae bacterium]